MPQAEQAQGPLALDVLREEIAAIDAGFDAIASASDSGERDARRGDLLRSIDRYLRLECEVFYPVLERNGIEHAAGADSNARLGAQLRAIGEGKDGIPLDELRASVREHRQVHERDTFPRAARALGGESGGLALELQEVRDRMKGAFGV